MNLKLTKSYIHNRSQEDVFISDNGAKMTRQSPKEQLQMFPNSEKPRKDNSSTFVKNMSLPIHRWFRYSAGFSAEWVRELIGGEKRYGRKRVVDPFVGSGTVLLEGERCDVEARGIEAHPFVARIAKTKLFWRESPSDFREFSLGVLEKAKKIEGDILGYPKLIEKCYPTDNLLRLDSLRRAWEASADGSPLSELTWLTLASILRVCSPVGTAQWQYVLPNKTKATCADPFEAFEAKAQIISNDILVRQRQTKGPQAMLHVGDARECPSIPDGWADLVVTSPPYANNYDYADATRLEMSFFGEVQKWGDLQEVVRKYLVRSCTQHVAKLAGNTQNMLQDPLLEPIREELLVTCKQLESERENHGGKKIYHTMIAAYFSDLAKVWVELRRITNKGSLVCFVVGDSAPYGIYVPVDQWLGKLAISAGFKSYKFEKTRDRNVKWKNRKHRVPLHEGRLWIEG